MSSRCPLGYDNSINVGLNVLKMFFLVICRVISWATLLHLGLCSVYGSGVQRDVSFSSLADAGCVLCYETAEESGTKSEDFMSCSGPYLFVGTHKDGESMLKVGAIASAEVVQTETARNKPLLSNGVYWHFERSCSFGFSATEHHQKSVEINNRKSAESTSYDFFWSLDRSIGCKVINRVGKVMLRSTSTSNSRNRVYNCPGSLHI